MVCTELFKENAKECHSEHDPAVKDLYTHFNRNSNGNFKSMACQTRLVVNFMNLMKISR